MTLVYLIACNHNTVLFFFSPDVTPKDTQNDLVKGRCFDVFFSVNVMNMHIS